MVVRRNHGGAEPAPRSTCYDLVVYENGGEPYFVPYVISVGLNSIKMAPRLVLTTGGTLAGNAQTRVDSWEKAIELLKK